MSSKLYIILFLITILGGCESIHTSKQVVSTVKADLTNTQEERWRFMVGSWYGSQPAKGGGTRQQLMERYPDGTYKITMKHTNIEGKSEISAEIGQWGIVGPVYFSIFRGWVKDQGIEPSDTSNPYNYDAYKIIKLDDKSFTYQSYSSGTIYTLKKVAGGFVFPNV